MSWPTWSAATAPIPSAMPAAPVQTMQSTLLPGTHNSAPAVIAPVGYTQEQWAQAQQQNWQQWAQWQQQYQQWHQQYGAEYQKSLLQNAALPTVTVPVQPPLPVTMMTPAVAPPLPVDNKPPLPPEDPPLPQSTMGYAASQSVNSLQGGYTTAPVPLMAQQVGPPPQLFQPNWQSSAHKRPLTGAAEHDPAKRAMLDKTGAHWGQQTPNQSQWQGNNAQNIYSQPPPQTAPAAVVTKPNVEELSEAEKKFDKEFAAWEAQFNRWKEQNANHPDKTQFREYEKKWESWRNSLLERREQMRRKRLGLTGQSPAAPQKPGNTPSIIPAVPASNPTVQAKSALLSPYPATTPPTNELFNKPPPTQNNEPLVFKPQTNYQEPDGGTGEEFLKSSASSGGIPGLDLVKEDVKDENLPDRSEVIPEEEKQEDKPIVSKGPDFEAISKGINSILGDQKLLNMLSMVSQNATIPPPANTTSTMSQLPQNYAVPPPNAQQYPVGYMPPSPAQAPYSNQLGQQEYFQGKEATDFNKFSAPPPSIGRDVGNNFGVDGPRKNLDNFNSRPFDEGGPGNFNPCNDNFNRGNDNFNREMDNFNRGNDNFNRNDRFNNNRFDDDGRNDRNNFNAPRENLINSNLNRPDNFRRDGFRKNSNSFNDRNDYDDYDNYDEEDDYDKYNEMFKDEDDQYQDNNYQNEGRGNDFRGRGNDFQGRSNNFSGPRGNDFPGPRGTDFNAPRGNDFSGPRGNDFSGPRGNDFSGPRGNDFHGPRGNDFSGPRGNNFSGQRGNDFTEPRGRDEGNDFQERHNYQERDMECDGPIEDDYNQDNEIPNKKIPSLMDMMAPPPPVVEPAVDKEAFFEAVTVIDYDHKSKGTPDVEDEVAVVPCNMFDYQHKPLNTVLLPERPKWLAESVKFIREFDPSLLRFDRPSPSIDKFRDDDKFGHPFEARDRPFESRDRAFDSRDRPFDSRDRPFESRDRTFEGRDRQFEERDRPFEGKDRPFEGRDHPFEGRDLPFEGRDRSFDQRERSFEGRDHPFESRERPYSGRDRSFERKERSFERKDRSFENDRSFEERDQSFEEIGNSFKKDRSFDHDNPRGHNSRDRNKFNERDNDRFRQRDSDRSKNFSRGGNYGKDSFEEFSDTDMDFEHSEQVRHKNQEFVSRRSKSKSPELSNPPNPSSNVIEITMIEDIINPPGRFNRPPRIVIILRGPPGSGKTFLAKQIKDKEIENGGSAPRILSLDDYFMIEQETKVMEDGRMQIVKKMVYEYEAEMEESYRASFMKSFKKTITDGYFPFIIVDNVNDKVRHFGEMWSYAKQNGFQVYICQMDLDPVQCTKRNIHNRSESEIEEIISAWEPTPSHHPTIDASGFLQMSASTITDVEMELEDSTEKVQEESEDNSVPAPEDQVRSKWDTFDCSSNNLAKLDGVSKPLRKSRTMEEYLQMEQQWQPPKSTTTGKKRVRWADLVEQRELEKMRAIGFVVGHTDWNRMMDPTDGSRALTQTKFIEKLSRNKTN